MEDVINIFKKEITANGISQSDVNLLEDTLGEKIISSNINIKKFTTERSEVAVSEALDVLEHYVPETSTTKKVYTFQDFFNVNNEYVISLQNLTKVLFSLTTAYTSDKKNTLFNLKHRWSWNSGENVVSENVVWDMFSKKCEMTQILRNTTFIREACGDNSDHVENSISDFVHYLKKNQENTEVNWEIGGYDTFITMGLINNEEIDSYIENMSFTPEKMNGEDLINFLDNIYKHYEYVLEKSKEAKDNYISCLSRHDNGSNIYIGDINKIERMEFLMSKNKITSAFLIIIKEIFDSMSNL